MEQSKPISETPRDRRSTSLESVDPLQEYGLTCLGSLGLLVGYVAALSASYVFGPLPGGGTLLDVVLLSWGGSLLKPEAKRHLKTNCRNAFWLYWTRYAMCLILVWPIGWLSGLGVESSHALEQRIMGGQVCVGLQRLWATSLAVHLIASLLFPLWRLSHGATGMVSGYRVAVVCALLMFQVRVFADVARTRCVIFVMAYSRRFAQQPFHPALCVGVVGIQQWQVAALSFALLILWILLVRSRAI